MKRGNSKQWMIFCLLLALSVSGWIMGSVFSRKIKNQEQQIMKVTVKAQETGKEYTGGIFGIGNRRIKKLIRRVMNKNIYPERLTISGEILIEEPGSYFFAFSANRAAAVTIGKREAGRTSVFKRSMNRISQIHLAKGAHAFSLKYTPAARNPYISLLWKQARNEKFVPIPAYTFFSPDMSSASLSEFQDVQSETRRLICLRSTGFLLGALFSSVLFFVLFKWFRRKDTPVLPHAQREKTVSKDRLTEIDKTKGFAGFLMIAAHSAGTGMLPFGTFGAALFFLCSGMNTILFLQRTRKKKYFNYYHLFFGIFLFTGGYTQIVIAHPGNQSFMPEFLQVSALSIILIFFISKLFKNIYYAGFLFPVPYLLHFFFMEGIIRVPEITKPVSSFFFKSGAFPLFPWAGFFLFGVFLLYLRKKLPALLITVGVSGAVSGILIFIYEIPIVKWGVSFSYFVLALFVTSGLYLLFYFMVIHIDGKFSKRFSVLEVVGRNSLMFVYVHYLAIDLFALRGFFAYPFLDLLVSASLAFIFSALIVFLYERLKNDDSLLFPVLTGFFLLAALRYGNALSPAADIRTFDIFIGMMFAFLYVKLRRKMRPRKTPYIPF